MDSPLPGYSRNPCVVLRGLLVTNAVEGRDLKCVRALSKTFSFFRGGVK